MKPCPIDIAHDNTVGIRQPVRRVEGAGKRIRKAARGQARAGAFHVCEFPRRVYGLVSAGWLLRVRHAGEHAAAFQMKVQALRKIYNEWKVRWQVGQGGGGEPLAAHRHNWQREPGHLSQRCAPRPASIDDGWG
ncbi:MAG: hypothetical protein RL334_1634 [Chloroflexota bacterium]